MPTVRFGQNSADDYTGATDAYLNEGSATTVYYDSTTLRAGENYESATRPLVRITGINSALGGNNYVVTDAKLYLRVNSMAGDTPDYTGTYAYRLLLSWDNDSGGPSWTNRDQGTTTAWNTAGADATGAVEDSTYDRVSSGTAFAQAFSASSWTYVSLPTALVQGWMDGTISEYGVIIIAVDTEAKSMVTEEVLFDSSEASDGNRPYLSLTYVTAVPVTPNDSSHGITSQSPSLGFIQSLNASHAQTASQPEIGINLSTNDTSHVQAVSAAPLVSNLSANDASHVQAAGAAGIAIYMSMDVDFSPGVEESTGWRGFEDWVVRFVSHYRYVSIDFEWEGFSWDDWEVEFLGGSTISIEFDDWDVDFTGLSGTISAINIDFQQWSAAFNCGSNISVADPGWTFEAESVSYGTSALDIDPPNWSVDIETQAVGQSEIALSFALPTVSMSSYSNAAMRIDAAFPMWGVLIEALTGAASEIDIDVDDWSVSFASGSSAESDIDIDFPMWNDPSYMSVALMESSSTGRFDSYILRHNRWSTLR